MPASRKGKTSQLGMRRLRRSVKVATATTMSVGHKAIECMPAPFDFWATYAGGRAIRRPKREKAGKPGIQSFKDVTGRDSVHGCLHGGTGVKQPIYTRLAGRHQANLSAAA